MRYPSRPARKMLPLEQLADYWRGRDVFDVQDGCFACQRTGALHRAHLVARCQGGLDGPQNVVILCAPCNQVMPRFDIDEAEQAINWVQSRRSLDDEVIRRKRMRRNMRLGQRLKAIEREITQARRDIASRPYREHYAPSVWYGRMILDSCFEETPGDPRLIEFASKLDQVDREIARMPSQSAWFSTLRRFKAAFELDLSA